MNRTVRTEAVTLVETDTGRRAEITEERVVFRGPLGVPTV